MAFNLDGDKGTNSNSRNRGNDKDESKAVAFLNFYLPAVGGNRRKLGAIPLRANKENEVALAKALSSGTEEENAVTIGKLMNKLELDFQLVTETGATMFDLG